MTREEIKKKQAIKDREFFEKLKDNPKPDILDLWNLSPEYFKEWRKIHDYPKLLNFFDEKLLLFKEWKKENKLTNEIIISHGSINKFLTPKYNFKNKKKFLIMHKYEGKEATFIFDSNQIAQYKHFNLKRKFEILVEFESYLDWLYQMNKNEVILKINKREAPNLDIEKVFIHSEYELLKMGGISAPINEFGILERGKHLEFVNLCGLKFYGEISYGEMGNLICSFCACDNMVMDNSIISLTNFEYCSLNNLRIYKSKIQQCKFIDCILNGEINKSQLSMIQIHSGNFQPLIKDSNLFDVEIHPIKGIHDKNLYAYKTFKKIYADQGDDSKAIEYFMKEKELQRKNSKKFDYIRKSISYHYWGYGKRPHKIIWFAILTVVIFGIIYWINSYNVAVNGKYIKTDHFTILDGLYLSVITFTTFGYGEMSPHGWLKFITTVESLLGVLSVGFLVAGFSNNKY
ncbi:MAG: ion channel [Bacteroidota bacterium]|nr:ion channel [Bacteroidota bacterium]